jgi:hypothetical protein
MKINVTNITDVNVDMATDMDDEVYDGVAITIIGPPNLVDYYWPTN